MNGAQRENARAALFRLAADSGGDDRAGGGGGLLRAIFSRFVADPANRRVRPYSTYDFGREKDENCLSVVVPAKEAGPRVVQLREALEPGLLAFAGTYQWYGDERHEDGVEVVVGAGDSQFDILRLARTDAANCDMDTEDLIEKLRDYDEDFGIDIRSATTDTAVFGLVGVPSDYAAFAQDLYEFCPDIVDQGIGSVEELGKAINLYREVYLWWD